MTKLILKSFFFGILTTSLAVVIAGQSSIVFVPTTDTQEKKNFYLSLESYAHFAKYENDGFQTYGPSLVYGLSKNVEIGINYYSPTVSTGRVTNYSRTSSGKPTRARIRVPPLQSVPSFLFR